MNNLTTALIATTFAMCILSSHAFAQSRQHWSNTADTKHMLHTGPQVYLHPGSGWSTQPPRTMQMRPSDFNGVELLQWGVDKAIGLTPIGRQGKMLGIMRQPVQDLYDSLPRDPRHPANRRVR